MPTDTLTKDNAEEWAHFVRFGGIAPGGFPRAAGTDAPDCDAALLLALDLLAQLGAGASSGARRRRRHPRHIPFGLSADAKRSMRKRTDADAD